MSFYRRSRQLDNEACDVCRFCYRSQRAECRDACRRCGISMFSDDTRNVYPAYSMGNFPSISYYQMPVDYQSGYYYGSYVPSSLTYQ